MEHAPVTAVILAAGMGTRMRSDRPKPLHHLCGRPMVLYVVDALAALPVDRVVVVVGNRADWVSKTVLEHAPEGLPLEFVEQVEQLGTGDAVKVALTCFGEDDPDDLVVLPGDTPLLRAPTIGGLVRTHRDQGSAATLLTAKVSIPAGYGRVVRGRDGRVARIVEDGDATTEELAINEVNTSIYCFRRSLLAPALSTLSPANVQGEYYLTDVVDVLARAGHPVEATSVADPMEVAGVNDRAQLSVAEAELRDRINERWMRRGVTMWDPERTYVDAAASLASDVVLRPGTMVLGTTKVSRGAELGPNAQLVDCEVGEGAVVSTVVAKHATIGAGARVGAFANLEEGAVVEAGEVVPAHATVPARR